MRKRGQNTIRKAMLLVAFVLAIFTILQLLARSYIIAKEETSDATNVLCMNATS